MAKKGNPKNSDNGLKVLRGFQVQNDLKLLKISGDPQTLLASDPFFTHFSPKFVKASERAGDGRWIAYGLNKSVAFDEHLGLFLYDLDLLTCI